MKRAKGLWAALAFLATSCIANDSPVRILASRAVKRDPAACVFAGESDPFQYAGSLDIAVKSSYFVQFDIRSELQPVEVTSGGERLASGDRNNFFINELVFSYASTPSQSFETEREAAHIVITSDKPEHRLVVNLIGPKAAQRLSDALASPGSELDLNASFEMRGRLSSGQPLVTNRATYPIHVYRSSFAGCGNLGPLARTGPCGSVGGQDGDPIVCCKQIGADGGVEANPAGSGLCP